MRSDSSRVRATAPVNGSISTRPRAKVFTMKCPGKNMRGFSIPQALHGRAQHLVQVAVRA